MVLKRKNLWNTWLLKKKKRIKLYVGFQCTNFRNLPRMYSKVVACHSFRVVSNSITIKNRFTSWDYVQVPVRDELNKWLSNLIESRRLLERFHFSVKQYLQNKNIQRWEYLSRHLKSVRVAPWEDYKHFDPHNKKGEIRTYGTWLLQIFY